MCDCGNNVSNIPNDISYDCTNIGTGTGLYGGAMVLPPVTTFTFKSLKAGANVNLTSDSDSITISSTDTGVTTLNNVGGGAAIGQSIVGNALNLRTLVGSGGTTVTQNANTVTIASPVGPLALSIVYNYLQITSYDLNNFGNFTGYTTDPQPGVSIVGNILTLTPGVRQKEATVIPITAYDPNGLAVQLVLKMYPNVELNYTENYFMGCDTSGNLYKLAGIAHTETLIANYDGTPVSFPNLVAMAMNMNDNILYYTLSTAPTTVRAYNFATKADTSFFIGVPPVTVRYLSYDNVNNVLYLTSATDGQGFLAITVTYGGNYGFYNTIPQPFTSVGCTKVSMVIQENIGTISYAIIPAVGNSQILQCYRGNSVTAIASSFPPTGGLANIYLTTSNNGRTYFFGSINKTFYSTRLNGNSNLEWVSTRDFVALCRLPYGI